MNIFFTFDYELFFGSNSGTAQKSIIDPTNELIQIANKYDVKFTFFIDSGYLLKLIEYKDKYKYVMNEYNLVFTQVKQLHKLGHSIQLHIHPHWEDSYFDGKRWVINTNKYRLHQFSKEEIDSIVKRYKHVLTDIVGDTVYAYRAGGWCLQPFEKLKDALMKYNIFMDSTIFYGGQNLSSTHYYDFTNAPKKDKWKFHNDVLYEEEGFFTELAISSIKLSPLFFWKFAFIKKFTINKHAIYGDGAAIGASKKDIMKMLTQPTYSCVSCDSYKSILLEKIYSDYKELGRQNLVIIGHPKAQSDFSLRRIEQFLKKQKSRVVSFTFLRNSK